jgi:hypothetical protein
MRRVAVATGAVGLVGLLLVAGCTSGTKKSSGSAGARDSATSGYGANPPQGAAGKADAGGGAIAPDASAGGSAKGVALTPTAQIVIADLTVQVSRADDVAARANDADAIARTAGGDVYSDNRTSGSHASATLVLKVPPARLADVVTKVSALGHELSRSSSTQDVTTEVADVDSRVASAQAVIDELRALLKPGTPLRDILAVESDLAPREAELESLKAQQRALTAQTVMATLTVHLGTKAVAPAAKHDDRGFLGGLSRGWHNFTDAAGSVLTGLGVALPFLVLLALVGGGALIWYRRHRPTATPPTPSSA